MQCDPANNVSWWRYCDRRFAFFLQSRYGVVGVLCPRVSRHIRIRFDPPVVQDYRFEVEATE